MSSAVTRLSSIEIKNFKNVVFGHIDLENSENYENASVLGLYGPNGSGKTTLIDALELLRLALSGLSVSSHFADYINFDSQNAELKYEFKILNPQDDSVYTVSYQVSLGRVANSSGNITGVTDDSYRPVLFNEALDCSYKCGKTKVRTSSLIDTHTAKDEVFVTKNKCLSRVGKDKDSLRTLTIAKELTFAKSRSFIFSKEFLDVVSAEDNVTENVASGLPKNYHKLILENLVFFGNFQLFVINAGGLNRINHLSLALYYDKEEAHCVGNITFDLNGTTVIPQQALNLMQNKIDCMNIVLEQLIPRFSLSVKTLGAALLRNGAMGYQVQLMCNKDSQEIPLQYESEGIKKLISVLHLLIVAYNDPSITVAIDDLDYGIFEYLLGELLRIFSEKGSGQLIFTAHDLRPLETLNKHFIAFTTTNPQNRYIRVSHSRTLNNLRDFYYRDIILGEQKESVYEPTNNSQIALAFIEAGSQNRS